jgi:hypothetical protein
MKGTYTSATSCCLSLVVIFEKLSCFRARTYPNESKAKQGPRRVGQLHSRFLLLSSSLELPLETHYEPRSSS